MPSRGYNISLFAHALVIGVALVAQGGGRKSVETTPLEVRIDMASLMADLEAASDPAPESAAEPESASEPAPAPEPALEPAPAPPPPPPPEPTPAPPPPEPAPRPAEPAPPPPSPIPESAPVAQFDAAPRETPSARVEATSPVVAPVPPARPRNLPQTAPQRVAEAPREVRRETPRETARPATPTPTPAPARTPPPQPPRETDPNARRLSQVANNANERQAQAEAPSRAARERREAEIGQIVVAALQRHASACWIVPKGIPGIESMSVTINVVLDRSRRVVSVEARRTARYQSDAFYRQFVDSAERSFQRPGCDSLPVPEDGYELWRNLEFDFDGTGVS